MGPAGYTPIKGVDYFTQADIDSLDIPYMGYLIVNDYYGTENIVYLDDLEVGTYRFGKRTFGNLHLCIRGEDTSTRKKISVSYMTELRIIKKYDDAEFNEVVGMITDAMSYYDSTTHYTSDLGGQFTAQIWKTYNEEKPNNEDYELATGTGNSVVSPSSYNKFQKYPELYVTEYEQYEPPTTNYQFVPKIYVDDSIAGVGASIDLSLNTTTYVMTLALKNAAGTTLSTDTVDLPLESVVVNGSYDSTNKKIILTLQSGSTIEIPVGDLVSGLQTEITSNNKLSSDLVDDTNHTNKFVTTSEKTTWSGKQDALVSGTNIKTVNNTSLLGSGNLDLGSDFEIITIEEIVDLLNSDQPETPSYDFTDGNWEQDGSTWYTTNEDITANYMENYEYGWEGPISCTVYDGTTEINGQIEFIPEDEYHTGNIYDENWDMVYTAEYKEIEVDEVYVWALVLTENL